MSNFFWGFVCVGEGGFFFCFLVVFLGFLVFFFGVGVGGHNEFAILERPTMDQSTLRFCTRDYDPT